MRRPDPRHRIPELLGALTLLGLLLAACTAGDSALTKPAERPEPVPRTAADAEAARQYLAALDELQAAPVARQAEIVQSARNAAEVTPTTLNKLRYALMLALPGHGASDPVAARRQLSELLARPELMLPAERALAAISLHDVQARLVLIEANRHLQEDSAARGDQNRDRSAAAARRLQAEIDENARLRKALDDAQKKLDAVTELERSIVDRNKAPDKQ
jgi:hypothetical protein